MSSSPAELDKHGATSPEGWGSSGDDSVNLRRLISCIAHGTPRICGFILIGVCLGLAATVVLRLVSPPPTVTRVAFSFREYDAGQYPDKTKFQSDDLRAPAVVAEALRALGMDFSTELQSKVRGAISIAPIVPANIAKEQDKARAAGLTIAPFIPNEYTVSLEASLKLPLSQQQRERLLSEIITTFRNSFRRKYGPSPLAFGTAFETLRNADFPEYELVLTTEVDNIRTYLRDRSDKAPAYRSPWTNCSFKDLLEQTELFSQIQLNEVLGLIHENGLSRNRSTAMMKLNHHLRLLEERERKAMEDERVVRELLNQAQTRSQSYLLGIKSQATDVRGNSPQVDQRLVDSLLANDAYNFLIRRALQAGLVVRKVESDKARLIDLRDNMKSFVESAQQDQTAIMARVETLLRQLENKYQTLIAAIRHTHADYMQQEYGNSIQLADEIRTARLLPALIRSTMIGAFLGFVAGVVFTLFARSREVGGQ